MYEDHPDLRRAATECICNLVQDEDVIYVFEKPDNDRVKLLVLFCGEEDDLKLNLAASGALAQLTDFSDQICKRIVEVKSFTSVFKQAACTSDIDFQFRIFYILRNIFKIGKDMVVQIVATELMDVIVALSRLDVEKERRKASLMSILNF